MCPWSCSISQRNGLSPSDQKSFCSPIWINSRPQFLSGKWWVMLIKFLYGLAWAFLHLFRFPGGRGFLQKVILTLAWGSGWIWYNQHPWPPKTIFRFFKDFDRNHLALWHNSKGGHLPVPGMCYLLRANIHPPWLFDYPQDLPMLSYFHELSGKTDFTVMISCASHYNSRGRKTPKVRILWTFTLPEATGTGPSLCWDTQHGICCFIMKSDLGGFEHVYFRDND